MEKERRFHFPQGLRYPFFLLGLVVMIAGGVGAIKTGLPVAADEIVATIGFVFLVIAIVFR